jgi:hypothetical protein
MKHCPTSPGLRTTWVGGRFWEGGADSGPMRSDDDGQCPRTRATRQGARDHGRDVHGRGGGWASARGRDALGCVAGQARRHNMESARGSAQAAGPARAAAVLGLSAGLLGCARKWPGGPRAGRQVTGVLRFCGPRGCGRPFSFCFSSFSISSLFYFLP